MFVQKSKGPLLLNRMATVMEFNLGPISNVQLIVHPANLGMFDGRPGIVGDPIVSRSSYRSFHPKSTGKLSGFH